MFMTQPNATAQFSVPVTIYPEMFPVGGGCLWFTDTPPAGFLVCRGQLVSRSAYARLFALWGTTYGTGDGSSTFGLPNLAQKFPLGKAAFGTGSTLGEEGGSIDHAHVVPLTGATTGFNAGSVEVQAGTGQLVAADEHQHGFADDAQTDTSNPPYLVVNFIVRY